MLSEFAVKNGKILQVVKYKIIIFFLKNTFFNCHKLPSCNFKCEAFVLLNFDVIVIDVCYLRKRSAILQTLQTTQLSSIKHSCVETNLAKKRDLKSPSTNIDISLDYYYYYAFTAVFVRFHSRKRYIFEEVNYA